jgi:MFS family permease
MATTADPTTAAATAAYEAMTPDERRRTARRVSFAAMAGTAIEFYDFFIYGTAAALIFREQFFPSMSPVVGTAVSVGTFAVGYISRPLGAALLSNFGDKYGRKNMLVLSMMIMGISTFLIGLMPTAASIGIAAPLLLIFLRLLQGFGVGAEQAGSIVMATEFAPKGKRGLYGGLAGCGVALGLMLANVSFLIVTSVTSPEWFKSVGWRIPFLFSAVLIGVGLYVRLNVGETPAFRAIQGTQRHRGIPFFQLFAKHWPRVLQIITLTIFLSAVGYTGLVFAVAYGRQQLGLDPTLLITCALIANVVEIPATIFFAAYSDRVGRKRLFLTTVAIGICFAFAFFPLLETKTTIGVLVALMGLRLITAGMYGPQAAIFSELFDTEVRFSGVAVGLGISNMLSAIIVSSLFAGMSGNATAIMIYLVIAGTVSFISGVTIVDGRNRDMNASTR